MIGRADIEGSKSYVAMNAWQPQASSFIPISDRHLLRSSLILVFLNGTSTLSSGSGLYLKQETLSNLSPTAI